VNILSQVGYRLIGDIAGHKENELYKKAEKARKENNSILAEKYEKEAKKEPTESPCTESWAL